MSQWKAVDFIRKLYRVTQGPEKELETARIEIAVMINGKIFARLELRKPGMVSVISRPDDSNIELEVIESNRYQFHDLMSSETKDVREIQPWHAKALGVD